MPGVTRRQRPTLDIWPGFVDALSALLIIIIFLLMVFTLAQFFLSEMLSGRNQALERLNRQVSELGEMLSLERGANAQLRNEVLKLSADLSASTATRERLSSQLSELLPQKDALESMLAVSTRERDNLQGKLVSVLAAANKTAAELKEARKSVTADKAKIQAQLGEIAQLNRDVTALRELRSNLEKRVASLGAILKARDTSLTSLRDRSMELEAKLANEQERTALAQKDIDKKALTIRELSEQAQRVGDDLNAEQQSSAAAKKQAEVLNRQLLALRRQLARLNAALVASEAKAAEQSIQVTSLGKRLNQALVNKVAELGRYRSEFFGRLREALGNRQGIRIVGDRFVFQSEVLFPSASSDLNSGGREKIAKLAQTLSDISRRIPDKLNWVLRVDGHTDNLPIRTAKFPSNWELSAARAIAVVKQLGAFGVPAKRLVAAGFGQFQPLDPRNDEVAYRRNRRIEFKLTQR
ncbi:MAG: chemotaxis protein [Rhodospirillaceae bacterium]|nr:chemotaxis protein [Rhodospirillaceae bacterium]